MKQTIEIDVPDGKLVFKDTKPPLPKTWLEFAKTQNYEKTLIAGVPKDVAKQHIALLKLHKLCDCYRCGWVPDWTDYKTSKYVIYRRQNNLTVNVSYTFVHFLSFQTRKLATEFLRNFRDLIEQAGDLI